ncbi:jg19299 [Pararge aegeria aegeria]|uniref:Jg19299 protein n=1 Tax=Pararge aegeria aegeria TaxID=348720 RepID=A0A8S4RNV5_9NEOP|nr:jg19299 [Pararge aegeria aegeria]
MVTTRPLEARRQRYHTKMNKSLKREYAADVPEGNYETSQSQMDMSRERKIANSTSKSIVLKALLKSSKVNTNLILRPACEQSHAMSCVVCNTVIYTNAVRNMTENGQQRPPCYYYLLLLSPTNMHSLILGKLSRWESLLSPVTGDDASN